MSKIPSHISHLLSANHSGECQTTVFVRRHSFYYGDEQNRRLVPPEWFKAGWEVCDGV